MRRYTFLPTEHGQVTSGVFALPLPSDDDAILTARRASIGRKGCEAWTGDRLVIAVQPLLHRTAELRPEPAQG